MQYPSTGTHTTARTATTDPLVGGPLSQSQSDDDSGCRVSDARSDDDSGCDTNLYDYDDVATDSFSPPLTPTPRRSTALPIYKTSEPDGFAAEVERRLRAGSESPDGVDNTNFYDHDDATTDCGSPRSAYEYDDVVAGVDGRGPEYVEPCSSDEGGSDLESDDEDEGFENDNDRVARVGNHTIILDEFGNLVLDDVDEERREAKKRRAARGSVLRRMLNFRGWRKPKKVKNSNDDDEPPAPPARPSLRRADDAPRDAHLASDIVRELQAAPIPKSTSF